MLSRPKNSPQAEQPASTWVEANLRQVSGAIAATHLLEKCWLTFSLITDLSHDSS